MTNPSVSMRRTPSDKSKTDIENHIKDLDARIAEAPAIAVDALQAQKKVWLDRLAKWKEPAKEPEPVKVTVKEPEPVHKAMSPKEGRREKTRSEDWLGPE